MLIENKQIIEINMVLSALLHRADATVNSKLFFLPLRVTLPDALCQTIQFTFLRIGFYYVDLKFVT